MIECSKPHRGGLVVSTRGGAALLVQARDRLTSSAKLLVPHVATRIWAHAYGPFEYPGEDPSVGCIFHPEVKSVSLIDPGALNGPPRDHGVICFDVKSEKFEVVNRSDDMALWGDSTLSIVSDAYLDFVGMTSRGEIVMSTGYLSNPFYVYYNNIEDNTITRVEVQGMEVFMKANTATSIEIGGMDAFVGCRVHISLSHVKDVKLM
uniref:F-box associated beta-propeller type 3 domain-containing protein n=1 Tax=Brassica oleracea var. oleracea TaxID=109376 RepID=A0A0D3CYL1_BRAOL